MPSPSLADVVALSEWLGQDIPDAQQPRAQALLVAASALVRSETGRTWLDDEGALEAVPDEVHTVVVACAARVWLNPSGVTQEATGPFSASYGENAAQGLYLTPTESEILGRYKTSSGLWTLPTTRDDVETDTIYLETSDGTEPMPYLPRDPA